MHQPSQQPQSNSSAGYRPLMPIDFTTGMGNSAYRYVAGAAGLGLVIGVAMAITVGHAKVAAAPQVSAALSNHPSGLSMLPAAYAGPAPSLLSQVENQKKTGTRAGLLSLVDAKSSGKAAGANKKHNLYKLLDWTDGRKHKAKRRPYVSPNPPAAPNGPSALQLATAAAATGPFFVGIQGDVTVANFDAATGTIQTYEGETYILDKTAGESSAIPWQNYPFDIHYRCDGTGNCTFFHGSATAMAKLAR
jgi:hypothetical protein